MICCVGVVGARFPALQIKWYAEATIARESGIWNIADTEAFLAAAAAAWNKIDRIIQARRVSAFFLPQQKERAQSSVSTHEAKVEEMRFFALRFRVPTEPIDRKEICTSWRVTEWSNSSFILRQIIAPLLPTRWDLYKHQILKKSGCRNIGTEYSTDYNYKKFLQNFFFFFLFEIIKTHMFQQKKKMDANVLNLVNLSI